MSTLPEVGERKLLRVEARNSLSPIENKPEWIKTKVVSGKTIWICGTWCAAPD